MIQENFIKLYEHSFRENWDLPCYTDYGENESYTYGEVAQEIAKLHLLFKYCSLRRGDKIAIIGKNNARWCIAYMAVITYGGIVVPILQDFNPNDVHHIVNHSESVFLFTSDAIWEHLEEERLTGLRGVFSLNDFRCLYQRDGETIQRFLKHLGDKMEETYPNGFTREDVTYTDLSNDKIMLLNYTSGTTGFSKGVMLTGNNLAGNVTFGIRTELLKKGDKVLSFLPLAHAYGCAFDFLTATAVGTHVTLLGKVPSPKILMKAFEEVKPNLIITVPLVIEKIYKNVIQPIINKNVHEMGAQHSFAGRTDIWANPEEIGRCVRWPIQRSDYRWRCHESGSGRILPSHQISFHHRLRHDGMRPAYQLRSLERIRNHFFRTGT